MLTFNPILVLTYKIEHCYWQFLTFSVREIVLFCICRFAPLHGRECDAVIIGDSIVQHIRANLTKGKVHTRCFPGARVLDVSAILKDDESTGTVVIHTGVNDIKLGQTEQLKREFRSLIETVCSTSQAITIIGSGPLPTYRRGHERFSRLFSFL